MSALSIATRGVICLGTGGGLVVSDAPTLYAAEEVRPTILASVPPETEGPAGTPTVVASEEMSPQIRDTEGPQTQTGQDVPVVVDSEELAPQIRKAEEE